MILYLKDGNKIHIKKKNRGKFTAYCGGNVTSACIAKAKASGNPTLVKRATFADNARHFKHRLGGNIMNNKIKKFQLGNYFEWANLSREDKVKRNKQIALLYLDKGPSILNYYNALKAYFGGFNPKNPYLITGEAPSPGIKSSKDIIKLFRATGTSGKFIPSLDGTALYAGLWFTDNIRKPLRYASSTFKKAKINKVSNPVELLVVEVPKSDIEKFRASNILKENKSVEYEPTEDFLIPLDYPRLRYPIEGLTGNLLNDMKLKLPIEKQGGSIKTANARKWKHLYGGTLLSNVDNRTDTTRKGSHEGLPAWGAADALNNAGLWDLLNYNLTGNPYIITGAPDILPGKIGTIKKSIQSVANINDKGLNVTKKLNTSVKNGLTYEDFDVRHVNAGRNKYTKALRERALYMITNSYPNSIWYKLLQDILKKLAKKEAIGGDIKKFKKQRYDVLDNFINSGFFR